MPQNLDFSSHVCMIIMGSLKTQKGGSYMPDIIMFEKPKQLYALGLVDKYDRIAACFVDPSTTHPEPEIVARVAAYWESLQNAA